MRCACGLCPLPPTRFQYTVPVHVHYQRWLVHEWSLTTICITVRTRRAPCLDLNLDLDLNLNLYHW